jgi:DNA-binding beta-propeller fold protein YncE
MNHLRMWSLVTAITASASLLLGASTDWRALVCDIGTAEVIPIDLPLGQPPSAETSLAGIIGPHGVAITPDATRAVVTGSLPFPYPNIFLLDLTTTPISIVGFSSLSAPQAAVALSPDGTKTYSIDLFNSHAPAPINVNVLNTSDLSSITTIPQAAFGTFIAMGIAISPNRPEAYIGAIDPITNDAKVFVISTDTYAVTTSYDLLNGSNPLTLAVTPNGSEVYVANATSNLVYYITFSDGGVHIIVGANVTFATLGLAVAPDGTTVYATQYGPIVPSQPITGSSLTMIDTSTHTVVATSIIPTQLIFPGPAAITPDGKTVCIIDLGNLTAEVPVSGQFAAFFNTTTHDWSTLQLSTSPQSALVGIAITPDQAPTARFTLSACGSTVTFDASTSSSPIGEVVTYAWDFGDGQTATTSAPTISHAYSTGGTFTVTLTVTNTGGTSTAVTFTGQTVSNDGGPSAVTHQQVTVQTPSDVAKFKGKVHRNRGEKKVFLKTKWSKSQTSGTKKYQIFARDTKIATVRVKHKRHKTIRLHPEHFPHSISKDYRHYLDHKYNVRAVDTSGHVSPPTYVHVKH